MPVDRPASIIVNNYNYARWLGEAIDSALEQSHPVEVVVVDDGSTDRSREVIAQYGERVVPVLQPNRGQAAALNAGFLSSQGDPVLFLDADDVLLPTALERAATVLHDTQIAHVHWYQRLIDDNSAPIDERYPQAELSGGDLREESLDLGPDSMVTSATSGNAFPRWVLERIMPIPSPHIRYCAELYPISLARLCGQVALIEEPQSLYRRHQGSGYFTNTFDRQLEIGRDVTECLIDAYCDWAPRLGYQPSPDRWRENSWYHRLVRVIATIDRLIPPGQPFLLLDEAQTGLTPSARRAIIPFPSRDGVWWGAPVDDDSAIAELERHREAGVSYLALIWTAGWYKEQYPRFMAHLRQRYRSLFDDELLTAFDLKSSSA